MSPTRTAFLLLMALVPLARTSSALGQPIQTRSPEAGFPRAWEAGMAVNRYTAVNLYNGNAISVFPIVSCDPVGPPLHFELYHNLAGSDAASGPPAAWGFSLGGGWRVAFGSSLVIAAGGGTVTLIEDDGNEWEYTFNAGGGGSGTYVAPAGKFDLLEKDTPQNGQWTVTRLNQWKRIFTTDGGGTFAYLSEEKDSAGNTLTIVRDAGNGNRFDYIKSAATNGTGAVSSHRITFNYDTGTGRLTSITDMLEDPDTRTWSFAYESASPYRLTTITDPMGYSTTITYPSTTKNRIKRVIDPVNQSAQNYWEYTYSTNLFTKCQDPDVLGDAYPAFTVQFNYQAQTNGVYPTVVTDRRGKTWTYNFNNQGELTGTKDPNNKTTSATYDGNHNRLTSVNELGKTWTATYESGTPYLATLATPISSETWTLTWTHPSGSAANFYRLTQVSDPLSHYVQYGYADSVDPTLVTSITEMADGQGNPTATTTLEYYHSSDDSTSRHATGQLKLVTDANGVKHQCDYDRWGYFASLTEGLIEPGNTSVFTTSSSSSNDAAGRPVGASDDSKECQWVVYTRNDGTQDVICGCVLTSHDPTRLGNLPSPVRRFQQNCTTGNAFDHLTRPTAIYRYVGGCSAGNLRTYEFGYDEVGRTTFSRITTDEAGGSGDLVRQFDYSDYDQAGHILTRSGPDGDDTTYTYDDLGRPKTVTRGTMFNEFVYDDASRLTETRYGAGTPVNKTFRVYDDANRPTEIRHEGPASSVLHETTYSWNLNNTLASRTEYDYVAVPATTHVATFTYDDRDKLIREVRVKNGSTTTTIYDLSYTYDQLGNRLSKSDNQTSGTYTTYYYDSVAQNRDPSFQTNNNRLLKHEDYVGGSLVRTVRYTYWQTGHVSNITVIDAGYADAHDMAFYYTSAGQLWQVLWDKWKASDGTGYTALAGREFRYDEPPARYMSRPLDATDADMDGTIFEPQGLSTWEWSDYAGSEPYADMGVALDEENVPIATSVTSYGGGYGTFAKQSVATGDISYQFGDLVRSAVMTGDEGGNPTGTTAYTAFGELVSGYSTLEGRYVGYCGGWSYESGLLSLAGANENLPPITLQHVGARWYQPGIGRFVQRDPIGLVGGRNVYCYVANRPLAAVDPLGLAGPDVGFPPPLKIPINELWSVLNKPITWRSVGATTTGAAAQWAGPVCVAASGGWWAGSELNDEFTESNGGISIGDGLYDLWENPPETPHTEFCFVAGTLVRKPSGYCVIEDVCEGDDLVTWCDSTDDPFIGTVSRVHVGSTTETVEITLPDESLECSHMHPFSVVDRGWTTAARVQVGDLLLCLDGRKVPVCNVQLVHHDTPIRVFDITLQPSHTYFVGESSVWVHNKLYP